MRVHGLQVATASNRSQFIYGAASLMSPASVRISLQARLPVSFSCAIVQKNRPRGVGFVLQFRHLTRRKIMESISIFKNTTRTFILASVMALGISGFYSIQSHAGGQE